MAEKVKITDLKEQVKPGDVLEFHYKKVGLFWIDMILLASIDNKLHKRKEFTVINTQDTETKFIVKVKINPMEQQSPEIQAAGVISVGIIVAICSAVIGLFVWVTLEGIYKITEPVAEIIKTPAGQVSLAGLGLAGIVGALLAVTALLKTK